MRANLTISCAMVLALSVAAQAQVSSISAIGSGVSNTTLPKQDVFVTTGYLSGSTTFDKASFEVWNDGSITNNQGTYGWTQNINIETGNTIAGNPDRGDDSASFAGNTSLSNVFSNTNKNLNWIIDGEGVTPDYTLDLMFGGGQTLVANAGQAHLLILERGMNSGMRVYGLYQTNSGISATSSYIDLAANQQTAAGFSIDTTEIDGSQRVGGWGIDTSSLYAATSGAGLLGYRFQATQALGHDGPDLVGVASMNPVPEPGTIAAIGLGVIGLLRRRKTA
ncbi:MAG TPA: PEP-CTERM sorting domain-containing protein [Fimbriimonadaceae bacterium]|nr:PEP-CTERM sorting domain-containing protein [Fimbriimonadaceae bacterium]